MRAIAFKEDDIWVAQCVERDVCVQSSVFRGLEPQLKMVLFLEREYMGTPAYRLPRVRQKVLEELPRKVATIFVGNPEAIRKLPNFKEISRRGRFPIRPARMSRPFRPMLRRPFLYLAARSNTKTARL